MVIEVVKLFKPQRLQSLVPNSIVHILCYLLPYRLSYIRPLKHKLIIYFRLKHKLRKKI